MKALFVTDLHGDVEKYRRLAEIAHDIKADVVINGGDMLPKGKELLRQGEFITDHLDKHFAEMDGRGIYYLCYPGNDDLKVFDSLFDSACDKYSHVVNLAQRKIDLYGYEFIGMNWVVDYPFRLKDRCRMDTDDYVFQRQLGKGVLSTPNGLEEIEDWFAYARTLHTLEYEINHLPKPEDFSKSIYVVHMPPYGLGLDKCFSGEEVGSKAIHDFLLRNQPMLSLHGHIHESPELTGKWMGKLGRTFCLQPGQLDAFTYVVIDLDKSAFSREVE